MIIIEGKGTLSVTEPGHSAGTYYEHAEIHIYGEVVVFIAHGKHHTAATSMCLIGWENPPSIHEAA